MPPRLATVLFTIGIAACFYLDREKKGRKYRALWIPTWWLFFCLSRAASQWLGMSPPADLSSAYIEGSPVDRAIFLLLEAAAVVVVARRWERVQAILLRNWSFALFFGYAALSILWSDFPFVTFKHWIKGIGDLMMVLIVLSEPDSAEAIKRLFTRLAFVLLPLSVLFIKYYPMLGRVLTLSWTMEPVGVATQKNGLGELCDFMGLALLWRFRGVYGDREAPRRKGRLVALGAILSTVVWLLWTCNSMTSICALSMASTVMLASKSRIVRRKPALVHVLVATLLFCTVYALFFQSSGSLIQDLGRNPTLTGRTDIWKAALSVPNSRLFGAGYESFWLGARLQEMWAAIPGLHVNEAHNGYIEIVLTLGWAGEGLLGILLVTGYRNVIAGYRRNPEMGSLKMAFFVAAVINALTEAAFRMMGPPWIVFLLATAAVPAYSAKKVRDGRRHSRPSRGAGPGAALREEVFAGR